MANSGLINRVLSLSPNLELLVRRIYWKSPRLFKKFRAKRNSINKSKLTDFNKIIDALKEFGVKEGNVLIVHSSFIALEETRKSPNQIIEELLALVGKLGTLAMNSARIFPEELRAGNYLIRNMNDIVPVYNIKKSKVWTGALPLFMLRHKQAEISKFPINPMVAIGKKAAAMMEYNLEGEFKTGCGKNSSWKYCVDHDAIVVGIGVDLTHSVTMLHVAEDSHANWPIQNWYRDAKYLIVDGDKETVISVKERDPKWGALHFAERTLCKDLIEQGILQTKEVDGVLVEALQAKVFIDYLNNKNQAGYPYFRLNKYLK